MVTKTMNNAAAIPALLLPYNIRWYVPPCIYQINVCFYYLTNTTM